jgi:hypothetical protein
VDGLGLLGDLLEHEVGEPSPFDVGKAEGDLMHALAHRRALQGPRFEAVAMQNRRFPVVEVDHVTGMRHQRGGIACHECPVFPQAKHDGAAVPGHVDTIRLPGPYRRDAVGADEELEGGEESA